MFRRLDLSYLLGGLGYGALGMLLGIHMAATHNHQQLVTHAHLLLAGFLLSVIYALIHRLWLTAPHRLLAMGQFLLHHLGVVVMVAGLFTVYGGHGDPAKVEPMLAMSSLAVLVALVLMMAMVVTGILDSRKGSATAPAPADHS